ncbi:MAG: SGNH/GDSL hydrolase family protein [Lachnospiraceae bacterium]|nr:SGNH/GDSL hydrolase family protein [Lachnospiraceae bacterium]
MDKSKYSYRGIYEGSSSTGKTSIRKVLSKISSTVLVTILTAACVGCTSNGITGQNLSSSDITGSVNEQGEQEDMEIDTKSAEILPLPTSFASEEELKTSDAWNSCNDAELASVMLRAEHGEPVTIVCIGGSITQGTIAKGSIDDQVENVRPYAEIYQQWWTDRFPQSEITFVNAGIGATDSYLGLHRLNRDVLACHPDVVLVEFSVNDADSNFNKCSYENLIRKLLLSENAPAVMLLFMAQTNGATAQNSHVLTGFHYNLPMVSYGNCMHAMMDDGHYTAQELSGDEVHPSGLGHAVVGEILWSYLNQVYDERESAALAEFRVADVLSKDKYMNGDLWDSLSITPDELGSFTEEKTTLQFPNGWKTIEGDGGIRFTADFRNLGILYLRTVDGKSGDYEILIDGEYVHTIHGDFTGGWGNAITAEEAYSSDSETTHTVEIRRAEDSENEQLILLGLLPS